MIEDDMPIDTQLICTSEPFCLCVGKENPWDECDCTGNMVGSNRQTCEKCGATFIEIDIKTGEEAVRA